MALRFPGNSHRLSIIGRTGTGKTVAGVWHLSGKDFSKFPWIVINTKREELLSTIEKMPGSNSMTIKDNPGKTGLHFVSPAPHEIGGDMGEDFMWRIHARGNCGLFIDEGYSFDRNSDALKALLTQGRSLKIPMIICSQKPKWMSPFTFSEADFFQLFHLNDAQDRKRCEEFVPHDLDRRLPARHSIWYDVGQDSVTEFSAVPPPDAIIDKFAAQLRPKRRFF